jgi:hypothetical protein
VDLVNKICRVAHAHERTPGVDIILPTVELLVALHSKMISFFFGFEEQTIRLQVYPFNIGNIT